MRHIPTALLVVLCGLFLVGCSRSPAAPPVPLTDDTLGSRARSFVGFMADGKYQDAVKMMNAKMASAMPAGRLKTTWETLIAQAGTFGDVSGIRIADESGYKVVYVTCRFKAVPLDTKVVFDSAGSVSGLWFGPSEAPTAEHKQPPYARADVFTETDCFVENGQWRLPATLTMPKGEGPFPAVVLVHGSGPHDRDETIGPNKPFKDLAMGLASKGIAVLRYEKRTKQYAQEIVADLDTFTVNQETVDDAAAAVAYLEWVDGVDPDKVFVVGHSLGASMAPRVALAASRGGGKPAPAGLVMMAPNARPLLDILIDQYEYLASLDGEVTENESSELQKVRSDVAKIKEDKVQAGEVVLGGTKAYWDDLTAYDPVSTAKSLDLPMLILQGERDYQVTMEDFGIWKDGLGSRNNVTLKSLPGLNHLFMQGEGTPSPEEYNAAGNVDAAVLDILAEWVKGQ